MSKVTQEWQWSQDVHQTTLIPELACQVRLPGSTAPPLPPGTRHACMEARTLLGHPLSAHKASTPITPFEKTPDK